MGDLHSCLCCVCIRHRQQRRRARSRTRRLSGIASGTWAATCMSRRWSASTARHSVTHTSKIAKSGTGLCSNCADMQETPEQQIRDAERALLKFMHSQSRRTKQNSVRTHTELIANTKGQQHGPRVLTSSRHDTAAVNKGADCNSEIALC